ncbi:MAG: hypothetical protein HY528_04570 [Chloroflexi bacterium]|nr:hypothetical protein [Chloroflexota bacterium]
MSYILYIGVDDTDIIGSAGTGKVARGLANHLVKLGLGESLGVSRHQLLVDGRIRYTSHNSAKGIALTTERKVTEFYQPSTDYIKECFQPGSDPGLCICSEEMIDEEIIQFGKRAVSEVLLIRDAIDLAARHKLFLKGLEGNGEGIIGALAAVGLRAWGNESRLVDLPGIREIKGLITVAEILKSTPICSVQDTDGKLLDQNEVIDSLDWIRPSLIGGQPVLRVKPTTNSAGKRIWLSIEKRAKSGGDD